MHVMFGLALVTFISARELEDGGRTVRLPISGTVEDIHVDESVPKWTRYKNKWAATIFETWQRERSMKRAILEPAGVFKNCGIEKVQELTTPLIEMDTLSFDYWLAKFGM